MGNRCSSWVLCFNSDFRCALGSVSAFIPGEKSQISLKFGFIFNFIFNFFGGFSWIPAGGINK